MEGPLKGNDWIRKPAGWIQAAGGEGLDEVNRELAKRFEAGAAAPTPNQ
ncbi:hypothetical protein [Lysobacter sp. Root494]|nr:hypothetical protein [Lysobacter sp. Root494]